MAIPSTRQELLRAVTDAYSRLHEELRLSGTDLAYTVCVDQWTVKDLLAVRVWWTEHVLAWIEAGCRGECPELPAPGYRWHETPRLNAEVVREAETEEYEAIVRRLDAGYRRVLEIIDALADHGLLDTGVYRWAGKWPVCRWISINTARQYSTARTYVRRVRRDRGGKPAGTGRDAS